MAKNKIIYFSTDPEAEGEPSPQIHQQLMDFLHQRGYIVHRAEYVFASNPERFMKDTMEQLGTDSKLFVHEHWVDEADIVVADVTAPSEGRLYIIKHALDKPHRDLPAPKLILIKDKSSQRRFGSIIQELIDTRAAYFEYSDIQEVIDNWDRLIVAAEAKTRDH